jgi:hypothetical protein
MEQNMLMSFYAVAASQLAIVECKMWANLTWIVWANLTWTKDKPARHPLKTCETEDELARHPCPKC